MTLLALGLNHTTAPVEIREKVVFTGEVLPDALIELRRQMGIDEVAILSTCNRTEIYCSLENDAQQSLINWLSNFHSLKFMDINQFLYSYPNANAVKHVLRVASGLDSMVLGEPQVLGQMKSAYKTAVDAGSIGQLLGRLFQHSFKVAKEIRSNTEIGNHPVSIAFAAVRLGQQIFGDLSNRTSLLIGAGETIELTAKYLSEKGLHRLIIANRTLEKAQHIAGEYSGYAITMDDIPQHLDEADIVITSTGSSEFVLTLDVVKNAITKRKHKPIYIVDIAVPRDVEPEAGELDDIYLYTVDDLKYVIEENIRNREQAAIHAEKIIDTQVINFMDWVNSLNATSTIKAIRDQAELTQQEVVNLATKRLKQGEEPEMVMQEMARTLTNKLIHSPSAQLRNISEDRRDELLRVARELFNLPMDSSNTDHN